MAGQKRKRLKRQIECLRAELSQLREKPVESTDVAFLQNALKEYRKTLISLLDENTKYRSENSRLNRLVESLSEKLPKIRWPTE